MSEQIKNLEKRQSDEMANWVSKWDCDHAESRLVRRLIKGGGIQIRHQCARCGDAVGNPVAHSQVPSAESLPNWDDELQDQFRAQREEDRLAMRDRHSRERSDVYGGYLSSDEWRSRRQKVLARAKGICEGCGDRRATEVHHLTYERWGEEMLFDLVALCGRCHDRIHQDKGA